ncbi:MAG: methylmalonyl Co-A mutase-associated GTPase MeaB [Thermoplasmatota archaeon]
MIDTWIEGVRNGQRRAAARLLSLIEREDPDAEVALAALHDRMGGAHVIGLTGSPGTGKSTLTDKLIQHYRRQGLKVGVLAIDPSSPFTGGAILGDRIRMQSHGTDPGVFIRSMGTRGALGGLSTYTADAVKVLDAFGMDVILVETVGVGQAEVDVVRLADSVAVVLVPNLGDDVQAVKAGVMEIADVFVVNKADLDGSDKVHAEVEASLMLAHPDTDDFWWPPILRTTAERGTGVPEVAEALAKHKAWAQGSGAWDERRRQRLHRQVQSLLERRVVRFAFDDRGRPREAVRALFDEAGSAHDVAEALLDRFRSGP